MKVAQKAPRFLHYFYAAISIHLSEKSKYVLFIWLLNTGLTVVNKYDIDNPTDPIGLLNIWQNLYKPRCEKTGLPGF